MNYLDYSIVVVILVSAMLGYHKGLLVQLSAVCAILIAYFSVNYLFVYLLKWFPVANLTTLFFLKVFSFLFLLLSVYCFFKFFSKILTPILDLVKLGFFIKISGAIFSAFKTVLLLSLLLNFLRLVDVESVLLSKSLKDGSMLYPSLLDVLPSVWFFSHREKL